MGLTALFLVSIFRTAKVEAKEGNLTMANEDVTCQGVSVWQGSAYKVAGKCQGLVYPFATKQSHYVLWAKLDNGNFLRIDDIDRGYFEGNVNAEFGSMLVTAEESSSPRRPGSTTVLSGKIEDFDFSGVKTTTAVEATPAPKAAAEGNGTMTVQNLTAASTSTTGSVISRILKSLLVIVGVIILITVAASLLFRRRGSVST